MLTEKMARRIYQDILQYYGPNEPFRRLVRQGVPEAEAREMVITVYRQMKWEMRKTHLWKLIVSGLVTAGLALVFLLTGRLYFIWIGLSGFSFLYSLYQFIFAVGIVSRGSNIDLIGDTCQFSPGEN